MIILNLLNPIKNTLDHLATASIAISLAALTLAATPARSKVILDSDFAPYKPGSTTITATLTGADVYMSWHASISSPIAATSLTISSRTANYRNRTTESTVYLLMWTKIQGGADLPPNGSGSSLSLNLSTEWGGSIRPIIETTGTFYTIGPSETVTISIMVGGTGTTHSSVVNQTTPQNEGFQMISGTYGATALAAYIGQTSKIRIASPDANTIGNRIIFYNIAQMTSVSDTTPPTLTSFEGNKSGGPILVNEPVNYTVTFRKPMSACS